jgi:hypothetical protein
MHKHQCYSHANPARTHNRRSRRYALRKLGHILSVPNSRGEWAATEVVVGAMREINYEPFTAEEVRERYATRCSSLVAS